MSSEPKRLPPRDAKNDKGWLRVHRGRVIHYFSGLGPFQALCKKVSIGTWPTDLSDRYDTPSNNACLKCCGYILKDAKRGTYDKNVVKPLL